MKQPLGCPTGGIIPFGIDGLEGRFLVSVLSRENQHELCVYARKFRNLILFGCWWFLNNPSIVEEITRERLEMLGLSFIPQNSDARVLEQLIYKWRNTRRTIAPLIAGQFQLLADGRTVRRGDIEGAVVSGEFCVACELVLGLGSHFICRGRPGRPPQAEGLPHMAFTLVQVWFDSGAVRDVGFRGQ